MKKLILKIRLYFHELNIKTLINRWSICVVISTVLTIIFYYGAVSSKTDLGHLSEVATIYNQSGGITSKEAMAIQETNDRRENQYVFTIWGESGGANLENPDLARSIEVNKLEVCGSTNLLFPEVSPLDEGDYTGCLIDEQTAVSLFGGTDVVGQNIMYGGKSYTIRGIIPNENEVFVIQTDPQSEAMLDTVTVVKQEDISTGILASNLKSTFGIEGDILPVEAALVILNVTLFIIPLSLFIYLIFILYKNAKESVNLEIGRGYSLSSKYTFFGKYPLYFWVWMLFLGGVILSVLIFVFGIVNIPQDFIPTKISDFEFWISLWEQQRESIKQLVTMPRSTPGMPYTLAYTSAFFCSLVSIFCFLCTVISVCMYKLQKNPNS